MRLVGPFPFIAYGSVRLTSERKPDGVTIVIRDGTTSGLDELSFRLLGVSETEIDAYEAAVKAFNNALALAKAKEAA
jgi:hypothetical protein